MVVEYLWQRVALCETASRSLTLLSRSDLLQSDMPIRRRRRPIGKLQSKAAADGFSWNYHYKSADLNNRKMNSLPVLSRRIGGFSVVDGFAQRVMDFQVGLISCLPARHQHRPGAALPAALVVVVHAEGVLADLFPADQEFDIERGKRLRQPVRCRRAPREIPAPFGMGWNGHVILLRSRLGEVFIRGLGPEGFSFRGIIECRRTGAQVREQWQVDI